MDVKGARALSERLAEAARTLDPPRPKAVDSKGSDRPLELAETPGNEGSCREMESGVAHKILTHLGLATASEELRLS